MFSDADLKSFLRDFGLPANYGGTVVNVIFDQPGQDILSNRVQSQQYEMTYITAQFPGLEYGSQVTIESVLYTVLNSNTLDDGSFSRAVLEAV